MNLLIIGSGGHAGVVIQAVEQAGRFKIMGLLDDFADLGANRFGYMILGRATPTQASIALMGVSNVALFVAVGDNEARKTIVDKLAPLGLPFPHIIHPMAHIVSPEWIGSGAFIAAGATVCHRARVGEFAIINTNASLDHDSTLGDFSHMAPNSSTGGHVKIGKHTLIGIGASIRDKIQIGSSSTIGMGSNVVEDVPEFTISYGNPARCK